MVICVHDFLNLFEAFWSCLDSVTAQREYDMFAEINILYYDESHIYTALFARYLCHLCLMYALHNVKY